MKRKATPNEMAAIVLWGVIGGRLTLDQLDRFLDIFDRKPQG